MGLFKYLLFFTALMLLGSLGYGQNTAAPNTTTGSTTQMTTQLGGYGARKVMIIPQDTVHYYNTNVPLAGRIALMGSKLYFFDSLGCFCYKEAGGGSGTVTAVTGVYPISSTGGTTPAISLDTTKWHGMYFYDLRYQAIGSYIRVADTAAMLLPYLRKVDSGLVGSNYLTRTIGDNRYMRPSDTTGQFVKSVTGIYPLSFTTGQNPIGSLDTTHWHSYYFYNTIYAPGSGSGNYIQNQYASKQAASSYYDSTKLEKKLTAGSVTNGTLWPVDVFSDTVVTLARLARFRSTIHRDSMPFDFMMEYDATALNTPFKMGWNINGALAYRPATWLSVEPNYGTQHEVHWDFIAPGHAVRRNAAQYYNWFGGNESLSNEFYGDLHWRTLAEADNMTIDNDNASVEIHNSFLLSGLPTSAQTTHTFLTLNTSTVEKLTGISSEDMRWRTVSNPSIPNALLYSGAPVSYTGGATTWTLPAASANSGKFYFIKNADQTFNLTLNTTGAANEIFWNTAATNSLTIKPNEAYILSSDGAIWFVFNSVNITSADTAGMLAPYLRIIDTATLSNFNANNNLQTVTNNGSTTTNSITIGTNLLLNNTSPTVKSATNGTLNIQNSMTFTGAQTAIGLANSSAYTSTTGNQRVVFVSPSFTPASASSATMAGLHIRVLSNANVGAQQVSGLEIFAQNMQGTNTQLITLQAGSRFGIYQANLNGYTRNFIGARTILGDFGNGGDSTDYYPAYQTQLRNSVILDRAALSFTNMDLGAQTDSLLVKVAGSPGPVKQIAPIATILASYVTTAKFIYNEAPTGAIDGVNDTYDLSATPVSGKLSVYLNGLKTVDYTVSTDDIIFNATSIPQTGDNILVDFISQ